MDFDTEVEKICREIACMLKAKNHDYGTGNIAEFHTTGVLVRASDKMARWKNLHRLRQQGSDARVEEKLDDTIRDLIGYCVLALMCERGIIPPKPG